MVSNITSGERLQLANFLERYSVNKNTETQQNKTIKELISKARSDTATNTEFSNNLENTAYAKYLDQVFSKDSNVKISGSGIDIQLSKEAKKILELTSSEDEKK